MGCRRHEDAVGYTRVEMHAVVERRAKAVEEGDAAVPRAGRTRRVGGLGDARGSAQQPLDLVKTIVQDGDQ